MENKVINIVDFSLSRQIDNAEFWSEDINQNYHPSGYFNEESIEVIYSQGAVNATEYYPILLKEWFFILRKNGYLIIDYIPNSNISFNEMEKLLWWLWRQKYELIYHGESSDSLKIIKETIKQDKHIPVVENQDSYRIICQKIESTKIIGDSIDRWTFGIISNGVRKEWVDSCIKSIRSQCIPEYEIIVCGTYFGEEDENLIYIPFQKHDDRGWITKKKNLIVTHASYQNICLVHDRYVFSDSWFLKMKEYGNSFEYLTNRQYYDNLRAYDWVSLGGDKYAIHKTRLIDYRDWDRYTIISGGLIISKKQILSRVPFNESLYWNDAEDIQLSFDMRDAGYISRINSATVNTLGFRFGLLPSRPFNKKYYWPDMLPRRILTLIASFVGRDTVLQKILFKLAYKTGIYKIFTKSDEK